MYQLSEHADKRLDQLAIKVTELTDANELVRAQSLEGANKVIDQFKTTIYEHIAAKLQTVTDT